VVSVGAPLLGSDPLFNSGIDFTVVVILVVKVIAVFAFLLISVMFYVWFMRKVIADMQNRLGPMKAGPHGVLQTLADGIKLFFKEQSIPNSADRTVFRLAPYLSLVPAFLAFSIVPIGGVVAIGDYHTELQLADPPIGILILLVASGIGLYGVMLAGWSSGSKYPLIGSVRASAQLLSYEAALGLSILGVLVHSGTLSTREIVNQQAWTEWSSFATDWYLLPAIVAFVIFLIAAIAETNHPPFDLVEAEQELVGGFHTEYTGIRFALFFLAEFMNVVTMSAIAVTLFLGGPSGPRIGFGLSADNWINVWIVPVFWFLFKLLVLLYATVWVRASLPRLRYDQLMNFGWKYLIEIAFVWVAISGVVVVGTDQGWSKWITVPSAVGGAAIVLGVLWLCVPRRGELIEEIR
jgi:NADH-quinone oxidoreductase subunit H